MSTMTTSAAATPAPASSTISSSRALAGLAIMLLTIGGSLAFALPVQWVQMYFRMGSAPVEVTAAQNDRYVWTAGIAVGALLVALVAAALHRKRGLLALTAIAFVCALIAAFIFQVPAGRFSVEGASTSVQPAVSCSALAGDCITDAV
ncbi:hypothetical protein FHX49_001323 [Microbacterium endophyticum]|uniref:Uncharacterized protein n=1 Tax=Microbacterium endophyticum TaxID=1526412 RepID=A0A7W4V2T0_9MICO|nr:hypothetical protein [Microbacterium endophyticum]MBB2975756.1 hypothetical protein [Microbacterium endophyticum]NIK36239.1 hypothetical protein [Microbacterium endophyticum]